MKLIDRLFRYLLKKLKQSELSGDEIMQRVTILPGKKLDVFQEFKLACFQAINSDDFSQLSRQISGVKLGQESLRVLMNHCLEKNALKSLNVLLNYGGDPNFRHPHTGHSLLTKSIEKRQWLMVAMLIQYGANYEENNLAEFAKNIRGDVNRDNDFEFACVLNSLILNGVSMTRPIIDGESFKVLVSGEPDFFYGCRVVGDPPFKRCLDVINIVPLKGLTKNQRKTWNMIFFKSSPRQVVNDVRRSSTRSSSIEDACTHIDQIDRTSKSPILINNMSTQTIRINRQFHLSLNELKSTGEKLSWYQYSELLHRLESLLTKQYKMGNNQNKEQILYIIQSLKSEKIKHAIDCIAVAHRPNHAIPKDDKVALTELLSLLGTRLDEIESTKKVGCMSFYKKGISTTAAFKILCLSIIDVLRDKLYLNQITGSDASLSEDLVEIEEGAVMDPQPRYLLSAPLTFKYDGKPVTLETNQRVILEPTEDPSIVILWKYDKNKTRQGHDYEFINYGPMDRSKVKLMDDSGRFWGSKWVSIQPRQKAELLSRIESPKVVDIMQGQLGDCYFLAPLASVVHMSPENIRDILRITSAQDNHASIHFFGRQPFKTKLSTLQRFGSPQLQRAFHANRRSSFAAVDSSDWVQLMEKAFAQMLYRLRNLPPKLSSIHGGSAEDVLPLLTGTPYVAVPPSDLRFNDVWVWNYALDFSRIVLSLDDSFYPNFGKYISDDVRSDQTMFLSINNSLKDNGNMELTSEEKILLLGYCFHQCSRDQDGRVQGDLNRPFETKDITMNIKALKLQCENQLKIKQARSGNSDNDNMKKTIGDYNLLNQLLIKLSEVFPDTMIIPNTDFKCVETDINVMEHSMSDQCLGGNRFNQDLTRSQLQCYLSLDKLLNQNKAPVVASTKNIDNMLNESSQSIALDASVKKVMFSNHVYSVFGCKITESDLMVILRNPHGGDPFDLPIRHFMRLFDSVAIPYDQDLYPTRQPKKWDFT